MPKKDKSLTEKVKIKIEKDTEESLRFAIIENFFNNYSLNTWRIYKVNFFRGLFFGAGSIIGGTVGIAFFVWFLSLFVDWPLFGESVKEIIDVLTRNG